MNLFFRCFDDDFNRPVVKPSLGQVIIEKCAVGAIFAIPLKSFVLRFKQVENPLSPLARQLKIVGFIAAVVGVAVYGNIRFIFMRC
jgi:hypothetical protein